MADIQQDAPQLTDAEIFGPELAEPEEPEEKPEPVKTDEGEDQEPAGEGDEEPEGDDEEKEPEGKKEPDSKETPETIEDFGEWLSQFKDEFPDGIKTADDMADYILQAEAAKLAENKSPEPKPETRPEPKPEGDGKSAEYLSTETVYNQLVKDGVLPDEPANRQFAKMVDKALAHNLSLMINFVNNLAGRVEEMAGESKQLSQKSRAYDYDRYRGQMKDKALSDKVLNPLIEKYPELDYMTAHLFFISTHPDKFKDYMADFHVNETKKERKRFGGKVPVTNRGGKKPAAGATSLGDISQYTDATGKWNKKFFELDSKDQARVENMVLKSAR